MFCNNCGYSNASNIANCPTCGSAMRQEPHISEVTLGNVVFCELCTAANIQGANYCRVCGRNLVPSVAQAAVKPVLAGVAASAGGNPAFIPVLGKHDSLLEKLDRMEQDLETMQDEASPESPSNVPDQLDAHEETLKTIAFTLDSLIVDLLEAEVREYTFPDFPHPGETSSSVKDKPAVAGSDGKKGRSLQEVVVMVALVAAIFLVGMTFGLWGSYFFGL